MREENIFLKSLHEYNFRHNQENAKVIGFVTITPQNLNPRPCFKVEYESDGKIDYITYESVMKCHWEIISGSEI